MDQFTPFNPTEKRSEARVTDLRTQTQFKVTKGAPHIIRSLAESDPELQLQIDDEITRMASRGFRSLGVAISYDMVSWEFVGNCWTARGRRELPALGGPVRVEPRTMLSVARARAG